MKKSKNILLLLSAIMTLGFPIDISAANNINQLNNVNIISNDLLKPQITLTKEQTITTDLYVQESLDLLIGQEKYLDYDTSADDVTFTSSDEKVATVDEEGEITAGSNGTAYITVTADDYDLDCEVTVYEKNQIIGPAVHINSQIPQSTHFS